MRRLIFFVMISLVTLALHAQSSAGVTYRVTAFEEFGPAVITLANGKQMTHKQANVSLKNGGLLYKKGKQTMQALTENIQAVDIAGRSYLRVDTALACVVDTIGCNKLLCVTLIDIAAYRQQLTNDSQITNLDIRTMVNVASLDASGDGGGYPLVRYYYLDVDGRIVKVHERNIKKALPKDKHRRLKDIIESADFSWQDEKCLMSILRLFK